MNCSDDKLLLSIVCRLSSGSCAECLTWLVPRWQSLWWRTPDLCCLCVLAGTVRCSYWSSLRYVLFCTYGETEMTIALHSYEYDIQTVALLNNNTYTAGLAIAEGLRVSGRLHWRSLERHHL